MNRTPVRPVFELAALAALYFLAGHVGLSLAQINPSASAIWAPSGIGLAAFLILGTRVWPAILAGAFLVNITTSGVLASSIAIAAGNTLEGLLGAMLVERFANGRNAFNHASDVFKFSLFGGLMACMSSATIGVLALCANGLARWSDFAAIWATWWLGDATGALVVGSFLLLAAQQPRITWNRWQALDALLVTSGFLIAGMVAFTPFSTVGIYDYPLFLLVIPLVLWSAFRLRPLETSAAILLLAVIAVWGTLNGLGPFARYEQNTALLLLQVFMAMVTMIGLVVAAEVHDRHRAEAALQEREQLYHLVIESANDAILTIDEASVITYANGAAEHMFGYTRQELIGRSLTLLMPERLRTGHLTGLLRYLTTGQRSMPWHSREIIGRHQDGHEIPLEVSFGEHRTSRRLFTGVIRDISERRRADSARRWLATIVANSNDAVIGKSLDGAVLSWNQAAERMFGYTEQEIVGQPITRLFPPDRLDENAAIMDRLSRGESISHFDTERICKDGSRIQVSVSVSPIDDGSGHIIGASSVARDITERKKAEDEIRHLAHHDTLTGLPNRMHFREQLHQSLDQAAQDHRKIALLFIDLDRFKEINDTLGHDVGDDLLRIVAQRLQHSLRGEDLVARLGGDEFVILLRGAMDLDTARAMGEKVLTALREPMMLRDHELQISASIGVGMFPDDGADDNALLRCADEAMYQAKKGGRGRCQPCVKPPTGELPDLPPTNLPAQPLETTATVAATDPADPASNGERIRSSSRLPKRGPTGPHGPGRRPTGVHTLPQQPINPDDIRFE